VKFPEEEADQWPISTHFLEFAQLVLVRHILVYSNHLSGCERPVERLRTFQHTRLTSPAHLLAQGHRDSASIGGLVFATCLGIALFVLQVRYNRLVVGAEVAERLHHLRCLRFHRPRMFLRFGFRHQRRCKPSRYERTRLQYCRQNRHRSQRQSKHRMLRLKSTHWDRHNSSAGSRHTNTGSSFGDRRPRPSRCRDRATSSVRRGFHSFGTTCG